MPTTAQAQAQAKRQPKKLTKPRRSGSLGEAVATEKPKPAVLQKRSSMLKSGSVADGAGLDSLSPNAYADGRNGTARRSQSIASTMSSESKDGAGPGG